MRELHHAEQVCTGCLRHRGGRCDSIWLCANVLCPVQDIRLQAAAHLAAFSSKYPVQKQSDVNSSLSWWPRDLPCRDHCSLFSFAWKNVFEIYAFAFCLALTLNDPCSLLRPIEKSSFLLPRSLFVLILYISKSIYLKMLHLLVINDLFL